MGERWVAMIRGINVGRAKRVAMADLRALVAELGYSDVRSLLNSGNIVFSATHGGSDDPAARIGDALANSLGVTARVVALRAADLASIVAGNPFSLAANSPSRLLVEFVGSGASVSQLEAIAGDDWNPEAIALGDRVAYLWCPNGVSTSRLWKAVEAAMGDKVTSRNWSTVLKLQSLAEGPAT
jgi:uncharacterized protein (DUF1697 family)